MGVGNVRSATFDTDPSGRPFLRIELSSATEPRSEATAPTGLDSLVEADLTPMLVFDVESLEIIQSNSGARLLMGLDADPAAGGPSLADLFDHTELDRLGSLLANLPPTWSDFGTWLVRKSSQDQVQCVRTWCGPVDLTARRLLLATPAPA